MSKKNKTILVGVVLCVIVVFILLCINHFCQSCYNVANPNLIIEKYNINKDDFNEVVEELLNDANERIHITRKPFIKIYIYETNEDGFVIKKVDKKNYQKYEKTIKFMKKLRLKDVNKDHNNIIFSINEFSQDIVKLNDKKLYEYNYGITEIISIDDNWYYIKHIN